MRSRESVQKVVRCGITAFGPLRVRCLVVGIEVHVFEMSRWAEKVFEKIGRSILMRDLNIRMVLIW